MPVRAEGIAGPEKRTADMGAQGPDGGGSVGDSLHALPRAVRGLLEGDGELDGSQSRVLADGGEGEDPDEGNQEQEGGG